jgi:phosphatidylglycerol---prolipoprotein diacylglyceryl transferase
VIATWVGLTLAEKRAERHGINRDDLNNLTFYGVIGFVLGGRILFALQNFSAFTKDPLGLISINPDLFDLSGALAAAFIVVFVYVQRHRLSMWPLLDALTPLFAMIAIGLGLSHLAAGTAFGLPANNLPWAIDLWNDKRHPTQIYETLASTLTLGLLWAKKPNPRPGVDFLIFTALTAAWQLFLSGFRADSTLIFNGLHREQLMAWMVLALCFVLLEFRLRNSSQDTK